MKFEGAEIFFNLLALSQIYLSWKQDYFSTKRFANDLGANFYLGLMTGSLLIFGLLMEMQGLYATLRFNQVHYMTLAWLNLLGIYYYLRLKDEPANRFIMVLFLVLLVFEWHDLFWLVKTHFTGVKLLNIDIIYPDLMWYFSAYIRRLCLIIVIAWILRKKIHISKTMIGLVGVTVIYHSLSLFYGPVNEMALCLAVDSLPWLLVLRKGKGKEEI